MTLPYYYFETLSIFFLLFFFKVQLIFCVCRFHFSLSTYSKLRMDMLNINFSKFLTNISQFAPIFLCLSAFVVYVHLLFVSFSFYGFFLLLLPFWSHFGRKIFFPWVRFLLFFYSVAFAYVLSANCACEFDDAVFSICLSISMIIIFNFQFSIVKGSSRFGTCDSKGIWNLIFLHFILYWNVIMGLNAFNAIFLWFNNIVCAPCTMSTAYRINRTHFSLRQFTLLFTYIWFRFFWFQFYCRITFDPNHFKELILCTIIRT